MSAKPKGDGDCYEAAAKLIMFGELSSSARLVHGNVTGQGPVAGIRFGHAWVEIGDVVLDHSNGHHIAMSREEYYRIGRIKNPRRYSREYARIFLIHRRHYGPWRGDPLRQLQKTQPQ